MRRTAAERILAVKYRPAPGRTVNATGTRRRIQALMAIGYPISSLAEESGVDYSVLFDVLNGAARVRGMTYDRVAAAYDWLIEQQPTGLRSAAVTVTKQRARREGWRDPQWWEDMGDIDDPTFEPSDVDRELNRDELAALRRSEIEHLARFNLSNHEIAARLDISVSTVNAIVRELHGHQKRPRKPTAA
ncbi:winged helix-turn-helix transcriptional regulator [Streptomyces olivaceus]|uniref:winged helix-turn-helix transcriptional regulator n=1 Tax=Streptomyces olivaceus TaxID=47716 RepID=UPI0033F93494